MNIGVKFESLSDLLADGLEDILADNYAEIETDVERYPLDVDWKSAMALERQGQFRAIGARVEGRLVGYSAFHIVRMFHSQRSTAAYNDVIFCLPAFRARCGAALVRRGEKLLRGLGVDRISYSTKPHFPKTRDLLLALRYRDYEHVLVKDFP